MKTWVRVNEDGRRIGESHPQAVLSDVEVDALLAALIVQFGIGFLVLLQQEAA